MTAFKSEHALWPRYEASGHISVAAVESTTVKLETAFRNHEHLVFETMQVGSTDFCFFCGPTPVRVIYRAPPVWSEDDARDEGQDVYDSAAPGAFTSVVLLGQAITKDVVIPTAAEAATRIEQQTQTGLPLVTLGLVALAVIVVATRV